MNIRRYQRQARRAYRALRARLRRARVTVALLVVLMLALGEPLLCILHCQIWLPIAYHSYFAAQHAHMHHTSPNAMLSAEAAAATGTIVVSSPLPESDPSCFMLRAAGNHDGAPLHVPPSPVHDLLPTLVLLIMLVLFAGMHSAAPLRDPPNIPHPLQLRPPIPFAV
jgi:hypothetical protein